jgi:hypothetical protein
MEEKKGGSGRLSRGVCMCVMCFPGVSLVSPYLSYVYCLIYLVPLVHGPPILLPSRATRPYASYELRHSRALGVPTSISRCLRL